MGDVEEGGKLAAVGNVIVMGSMRGSVEAGCMGNDNAYIIAMDFAPEEIRIAKAYRKFEQSEFDEFNSPQKVFTFDERIFTENFDWKK